MYVTFSSETSVGFQQTTQHYIPEDRNQHNDDRENNKDRLCGLVNSVPGYRSRGPGSIPGATRFSEK
jgi:hypothetical protein